MTERAQGAGDRRRARASARRSPRAWPRTGMEVLTLDLREGCDIALDVARDEFPPLDDIDVCVANAGVTTTIAPGHRMTAEQWQLDIDVNLTGAFRTIQACLGGHARAPPRAHRRDLERGRARRAAGPGRLRGLEGRPARAWCARSPSRTPRRGITVNAVLPGLVGTEQVLAMPEEVRERALAARARRAARRAGRDRRGRLVPRGPGGGPGQRPDDRRRRRRLADAAHARQLALATAALASPSDRRPRPRSCGRPASPRRRSPSAGKNERREHGRPDQRGRRRRRACGGLRPRAS